ncbi:MAG: 3-oxoacyl-[acyl-carrier-protein] reductase [Planctomycetota bacterium]
MKLGLEGKVAVVTGASRGIGRAIALALAEEGCAVACVATSEGGVAETVSMAAEKGVDARGYGCDVSNFEAAQELGKTIAADFGGVDILVNNAGVTRDGLFMRMSEENWDRVLDVNLKGAFNVTRALTRPLMKSEAGRVINIASVVGLQGNAGQANYAASKGGLIAMTKALAKELASRSVCVNAVAPGFIETDMTSGFEGDMREGMRQAIPLQRFGAAEDIANAVCFLAGRSGGYVTGQTLVVDGGMAI